MLGRNGGGRLRRVRKNREDLNPMHGLANLADAMLVLAVGIMLALIVSWNLKMSTSGQVMLEGNEEQQEQIQKSDETEALTSFTEDDIESVTDEQIDDKENLEERGTVYYDPKSDTYYIMESQE